MPDLEALVRDRILSQPFGSMTKAELEFRLFWCLADAGMVGPSLREHDVSRSLGITTTKARNLLYQLDLRQGADEPDREAERLAEAIVVVDYTTDDDPDRRTLTLGVESRYLREQLVERLKSAGVWSDARLNGQLVVVKLSRFIEAMPDVFAGGPYDDVIQKLQDEDARKLSGVDKALAKVSSSVPSAVASSTVAALFGLLRTALGL